MGFSASSALRFGWETFKKRPWFFIGAFLLFLFAQSFLNGLSKASETLFPGSDADPSLVALVIDLAISFGLGTLVSMGANAFLLAAHDNPDTVKLSALWHPHPFWKYLGLFVLFSVVTLAGIVLGFVLVAVLGLEFGLTIAIPLLVVLGVLFSLMFIFSGFLVIDRELGPIEAMKESYRMTSGYRWDLLGFFLLLFLINMLGLLAFVIGVFVSAPVSLLALTHAYRVLAGGAGTRPADATLAT